MFIHTAPTFACRKVSPVRATASKSKSVISESSEEEEITKPDLVPKSPVKHTSPVGPRTPTKEFSDSGTESAEEPTTPPRSASPALSSKAKSVSPPPKLAIPTKRKREEVWYYIFYDVIKAAAVYVGLHWYAGKWLIFVLLLFDNAHI